MTMLLNRTLCLCLLINLDKSHDETVGTKWNGIDLPEGFRSHDGPVQYVLILREGCGKSKWKFKMAFAMKGGGSRGGLECHIPILKNDFC